MPRPPHRVTDIAAQSGLSRATVDRVLHRRPGVRPQTVAQVERALAELDRQQSQVLLSTRAIMLDLVMQAPQRFANATRSALETELSLLHPTVVRARSHLRELSDPAAAAHILDTVLDRGSDGVILKAPEHPEVTAAVRRLQEAGIPTVTYVTDLPQSARVAYVGLDNHAAGATAAYLITGFGGTNGTVLVTLSSSSFHGEEQREVAFRQALSQLSPKRDVLEVTNTDGQDATMYGAVMAVLADAPQVDAVYSPGGGNAATLRAFDDLGRSPTVFIAHDLDADNVRLLRTGRLTAVLHHDLGADLRRAVHLLLQARGLLRGSPLTVPSQAQVVTRYNEPHAYRPT